MENLKHVALKKSDFGYGFLLKDDGKPFGKTALVIKVEPGGPAELGGIRVGCRVQALNGKHVQSMTFLQTSNLIRSSGNKLEVSFIEPNPNASEMNLPFSQELQPSQSKDPKSPTLKGQVSVDHPVNGACVDSLIQLAVAVSNTANPSEYSISSDSTPKEYTCLSPSPQVSKTLPNPASSTLGLSPSSLEGESPAPEHQTIVQPCPSCPSSPLNSSPHKFAHNLDASYTPSPRLPRKTNSTSGVSPLYSKQQSSPVFEERILYPSTTMLPRKQMYLTRSTTVDMSASQDASCQQDTSDEHSLRRPNNQLPTRRMTIDRPESNEELTETVHFVRKRAYASARHSNRPELCSPRSAVGHDTSGDSPCQLLPASPQHPSPGSFHTIEPHITHLPGRRSSGRVRAPMVKPSPSSSVHVSPGGLKLAECPLSSSQSTDGLSSRSTDPDLSLTNNQQLTESLNAAIASVRESLDRRRVCTDERQRLAGTPHRRPVSPQYRSKQSATQLNSHSVSHDAPSAHPNKQATLSDNPWVKAGEAYQEIEAANQKLARKFLDQNLEAELAVRQRDLMLCDAVHGIERSQQNKENRIGPPGYDAWLASESWYSSKQNRTLQLPRVHLVHSPAVDSLKGVSPHGTVNRLFVRNQRPDAIHDLSGSFFSRQCMCRILTIDGSLIKSYHWKAYFMCIRGNEVRFIKASWAYISTGRKAQKPAPPKSAPAIKNVDLTAQSDDWISLDSTWDQLSLSDKDAGVSDTSQFLYPNTDEQDQKRLHPLSASCILLPIKGLVWIQEDLPSDFPEWSPMGSVSSSTRRKPAMPAVTRDYMDPSKSGISRSDSSVKRSGSNETTDLRSRHLLRCYRFAHPAMGVELLYVFPDESAAQTCLKLCEMSGGKAIQLGAAESNAPTDGVFYRQTNNPYTLRLLPIQTSPTSTDYNERRYLTSRHPAINLSDKRQRRTGQRRGAVRARSSERPSPSRRQDAEYDPTRKPTATMDDIAIRSSKPEPSSPRLSGADEKLSGTSFTRAAKNPFLHSLRQLLNWPNPPIDNNNAVTPADQPSFVHLSPKKLKDRLDAILGDPPDFSDVDNPGPTFGCPLEQQLESPDYPYVPALLHAFLASMNAHGLHLPGMYRRPGRQRSMNQFICVANLLPHDVDFLLTLDAWREPYAIGGLVKQFLRRLPKRLLNLATWEPLTVLVPDRDSPFDSSRLAYLLLSIRVKLSRMAQEALGLPPGRFFSLDIPISSPDSTPKEQSPTLEHNTSSPQSPRSIVIDHPSNSNRMRNDAVAAKWHWSTFCYVVKHLRRLVSYEQLNEVNYQCVAICFGPVLFDDSCQVDKLNFILECILRHWPWLSDGLPTSDQTGSNSPKSLEDSLLTETINYLEHFDDTKPELLSGSEQLADSHENSAGRYDIENNSRQNSSDPDCLRSTRLNSTNALDDVQDCVRSILLRALKISRQFSAPEVTTVNIPLKRSLTFTESPLLVRAQKAKPGSSIVWSTRRRPTLEPNKQHRQASIQNAAPNRTTRPGFAPRRFKSVKQETKPSQVPSIQTPVIRRPSVPRIPLTTTLSSETNNSSSYK